MDAVFLKLVNMSITASWLILAVVLMRLLLKKAPKWITCALWVLVAVRLVCPVSPESALSLIPSNETIPEEIFFYEGTQQHNPAWIDIIDNPVLSQGVSLPTGHSVSVVQTRFVLWTLIWLIGMAALLLYALISCLRLKRRVEASIPVRENVFACDEVQSPFILGVVRPRIYVPSSMKGETLDYVMTHETAHIRRHDHWWKPFGYLLLTIYWFNPLCWLAYVLLCRDIELACDEKVVRALDRDGRAAYSQALLDCSFPRRKIAACPLAFGEVGVKERVKSVLNYKKPAFWIVVAAVIACIVIAVCFLTNPQKSASPFPNDEIVQGIVSDAVDTIYYPPTGKNEDGIITIGYVRGSELAAYLDGVSWQEWDALQEGVSSPGSIEFCVRDDDRITVYQKPRRAKVSCGGDVRWYKTHGGDYDDAVGLFRQAAGVQIVDEVSGTEESSCRAGAALSGTDFSSIGQTLADRLAQEWSVHDDMTAKLTSSHLPGAVSIEADTWTECETAIGFKVDNPLESIGWIDPTGYIGMESAVPGMPIRHVQISANAVADRTLHEISMTAGYHTGNVRITLTAALAADTGIYTTGSAYNGYAAYEQKTAATGSGIPVLIVITNGTNNFGYYHDDYYDPAVYWVKDNTFYTLRVLGALTDRDEIQTILDRILAEI